MLFRIFSAALLGGAVAYFAINLDSFQSLDESLLAEEKNLEDVESLILAESKSAESNMTALLKINREYRKEFEQLEEGSEGAKDELSFLSPKIKSLNEQLMVVERELISADEEINKIKLIATAESEKISPLETQKQETLEVLNQVSQSHANAEENWRKLDQKFSSLKRVREAAKETYQNTIKPLMEEIVRPFEIFYGDTLEVEIENVSEKEKGFFTKVGLEQGMQSGFTFLIQSDEDWSEIPQYLTCSLAEKNYSFLKMLSLIEGQSPRSFRVGKKLTLIRSAELTNSDDSSNLDDKKAISQTDL